VHDDTHHRLVSVDWLRGLVMVIMALDHVRDLFSSARFSPTDLTRTTPSLFITRWVTHFCAPTFVFLAGAGAYLWAARGRTKSDLARFLLVRGLWLIVLELTAVRFAWFFKLNDPFILFQVVWALGWSMIVLAGLVFLPTWAVAAFGIALIAGQDLLDRLFEVLDTPGIVQIILHAPRIIDLQGGVRAYFLYSLIPWIGVMALGYAIGPLLVKDRGYRRTWLVRLGIALTLGFILLRATNLYGDPHPWSNHESLLLTALSFINTEKYPASLLFLMMTIGPALLALAFFDRAPGPIGRVFVTFGRVPLFYYVLHLMLLHAMAVGLAYSHYGRADWLFGSSWLLMTDLPPGYGYGLGIVYLLWIIAVILTYPLCRWYAAVKQRSQLRWLSYF